MNNNEMTIGEFTPVLNYLLDNNKKLEDKGLTPIAIGLEGAAGIGKTTVIEDIAKQRNMTFCKINLSMLEEVGDLTGFPQKEVLLTWLDTNKQKHTKWWPESLLDKVPSAVTVTDKTRLGYATPAWLPQGENPNGTLVVLDDYSRASSLFMQATMELINTCAYISWHLPKYTSIILTTNPDNGEYSVSSLDNAQKTRFTTFNLKLDVNEWAAWAEKSNIDSRCINFELAYGHEIFNKQNGIQTMNPRAYTTFCKAISGIENWDTDKALALILSIAKGCFLDDKNNIVGTLFTTFVQRKLDKLVNPEDMLMKDWKTIEPRIYSCVYSKAGGEEEVVFKPEISSILATRLLNYALIYLSKNGVKEKIIEDRLLEIINNKRKLFSEDNIFHVIKTLVTKYPGKTTKLMVNPAIRNRIVA